MANPLKKLIGQTAIYGLSSIIGRFLNYLLTPLWTGVFSKEQFGIITEMYAYVAFLVVLLTYGMETTFFRFANKPDANKDHVFSTASISVTISSIVFITTCIIFSQEIANWLMYPNHNEYVIWFAIIVGLDAITSIPFAKLRLENKASKFALVNLVNIFVNIGLNLFFLYYCKSIHDAGQTNWWLETFYNPEIGVGYVFISNLISSIIKFILLLPENKLKIIDFNKPLYKKMVRYTTPLLFVGLAGIINETLDRILLKRLLILDYSLDETMGLIGIYGANYKLSIVITLFIQAFRYAAEPFFFSQAKENSSTKIYADVMNYFIIALSGIFLGVMLHIDYLKYFINNEELWAGLDIVPILMIANIFLGIYYNLSIWYKLSEKTGYGAIVSIIGAISTIVLNLALIPLFGYRGSAWATLICYFIMILISYYWGKKHFPIPYKIGKGITYISLSLGLYLICNSIKINSESTINFLVNLIAIIIFIGFVIWKEKINKNILIKKSN